MARTKSALNITVDKIMAENKNFRKWINKNYGTISGFFSKMLGYAYKDYLKEKGKDNEQNKK